MIFVRERLLAQNHLGQVWLNSGKNIFRTAKHLLVFTPIILWIHSFDSLTTVWLRFDSADIHLNCRRSFDGIIFYENHQE